MGNTVVTVDIGRVRPFADQPREYFDAGELIALELSIKQRGQLQPAMIRKVTDDRDHDYELVDGQRRWHACTKLGIPLRAVIIDPENEEDQFEISVAANFQRAGHTPMEIAKAIQRMCTHGERTVEYVATLFGKSVPWVYQQRRLVELVPEIQQRLEPNSSKTQLPTAIASELARLPKEQQLATLEDIEARGLTTPRAVDKIRRMVNNDGSPERRKKPSDHTANIERFIRQTIQRADFTMDRMGPDDMRLLVTMLVQRKKFDHVRESVMTAIGRLEVLHRRITETRQTIQIEAPTKQKPQTSNSAAPAGPYMIYSQPFTCPKCKTTGTRFRRWSNADLQKEHWECIKNGCLIKISHYDIKIDKTYQPAASAAAS